MNECELCLKLETDVPLFVFTITRPDGDEWEEILCATCANRMSRSIDIHMVGLLAPVPTRE